jgi:sugar phosphate isomerase/epimerase
MKIGINTVLFKDFSLQEAFAAISRAGYDGVELSAIAGMCEHLVLDGWEVQKETILALSRQYNLALLSMEVASLDPGRLSKAFAAAKGLGIPVVNVGPGGKSGDEAALKESLATLRSQAELAGKQGVTLCAKAHVGAAIYNTPTTLKAMDEIKTGSFGIDMDPSHIHRAGEIPKDSLKAVVARVRHVHIRDCKGAGPSPGEPLLQICGRGDIDLYGYFKVLAEANYAGPVCLEVIGPSQSMEQAVTIAAESAGYMKACLKSLGAR